MALQTDYGVITNVEAHLEALALLKVLKAKTNYIIFGNKKCPVFIKDNDYVLTIMSQKIQQLVGELKDSNYIIKSNGANLC